ncbi:uncharacterized protein MELLADRAFT_64996 [Melampsora larici-populina 98AG31]|uniref:Uncharacterized protein n=1 Tax=Melampsora larici-populina (strain 98AG31 / pathotype 3-4-7) TaxID=747676 RepID=F4RTK2_MELLP|nr:uncharacterized protein MELLADRAFT_64996 [Melampsora larici-populina 98AG31]EGG04271.1 hypothetical protein MELLADRAFT_64996 [Melampsora larici-populina 98AG31]
MPTGSSTRRLPAPDSKINTNPKASPASNEVSEPSASVSTKSSKKKRCASPETKPVQKKRAVSVKATASFKKLEATSQDSKALSIKRNEIKVMKKKGVQFADSTNPESSGDHELKNDRTSVRSDCAQASPGIPFKPAVNPGGDKAACDVERYSIMPKTPPYLSSALLPTDSNPSTHLTPADSLQEGNLVSVSPEDVTPLNTENNNELYTEDFITFTEKDFFEGENIVHALEARVDHLEKEVARFSDLQEHVILQIQEEVQKSIEGSIKHGIKEATETLKAGLQKMTWELQEANDAIKAHDEALLSLLNDGSNSEEQGADDDQTDAGSSVGSNKSSI